MSEDKKVLNDEELENASGGAILVSNSRISEQTKYIVNGAKPVNPLESCGNAHIEPNIENAINAGVMLGLDNVD